MAAAAAQGWASPSWPAAWWRPRSPWRRPCCWRRRARFVDLDGPLLLAKDRDDGLRYEDSLVYPPLAGALGLNAARRLSRNHARHQLPKFRSAIVPHFRLTKPFRGAPRLGLQLPFKITTPKSAGDDNGDGGSCVFGACCSAPYCLSIRRIVRHRPRCVFPKTAAARSAITCKPSPCCAPPARTS